VGVSHPNGRTDVELAAECLGQLQEIQALASEAIETNTLEAFEEALDAIADLACDVEHT
jgi:hypothetical protein